MERTYIAIDLKSFYASVECTARGLDPLNTNLVVADESRTEKTICLAVSPSLKSFGIGGRARLFEVIQRVGEVNAVRQYSAPDGEFKGSSVYLNELEKDKSLSLDYIVAPPRMAEYMKVSTEIYMVYLEFVSPEDIHVYSIDEVFIDATKYLDLYKCSAHDLAMRMINAVLSKTGITATAGIGSNLYLCKIAMDIVAKHMPADENGVRIAELNERSYRELLWDHTPLTSFWRVGNGTAKRLEKYGIRTMGDIARCSLGETGFYTEELLYKEFGINAELLIDHAWGYESCTIEDIKGYTPEAKSVSSGQVLSCPYDFEKARLVIREMTDLLVLDLVDKRLVTDQIVLTIGYDIDSVKNFSGEIEVDRYNRKVPKQAHSSINLGGYTSSTEKIIEKTLELYDEIVNPDIHIRRMYVVANHVITESLAKVTPSYEQLSLFTDYEAVAKKSAEDEEKLKKEKSRQKAILEIQRKYGKNAILKGFNFEEGGTTIERNGTIGGHKA